MAIEDYYIKTVNIIKTFPESKITDQYSMEITLSGKVYKYPITSPSDLIDKDGFCITFEFKQGKGTTCYVYGEKGTLNLSFDISNLKLPLETVFERSYYKEEIQIQHGDIIETHTLAKGRSPLYRNKKVEVKLQDIGDKVHVEINMDSHYSDIITLLLHISKAISQS